jgi:sterol 3beta-glucosyltransferase
MNILILALGSRGDVLPYASLGEALRLSGHRVRIVTFQFYQDLVDKAGLEIIPIPGDALGILQQAADGLLTASKPSLANPLELARTWKALRRSYGQLANSLPEQLSLDHFPDTDLVLNQLPAYLFGEDIAQALSQRRGKRIPWGILSVIPLARSHFRPLMGFQKLPLRGRLASAYNWNTYRLGEQVGWQLFRTAVNRWRKAQDLPAQPFFGRFEALQRGSLAERPAIIQGFSPLVVPRLPDWEANIYTTGWWWPADTAWAAPSPSRIATPPPGFSNPALEHFLQSGEPPIFIGMGSMPLPDPAAASQLFCQAAELAGARLVLHTGWANLPNTNPSEKILHIHFAPYAWLFPHMRLVVHHGGSGTTGYALAAGVPSLVLPFTFDQFFWGSRTAELGVGPLALPFARLTAEKLAAAISQALTDPTMQQKAQALSEKLRSENGLRKAVEIVESIIM